MTKRSASIGVEKHQLPNQPAGDSPRQVNTRARRRQTPRVITRVAKARFLESFRVVGIIGPAAAAAGVARQTIYRWQEHDDVFSAAFNLAREEALDALEAEARRRAVDGVQQVRPIYYRGEQVGTEVVTVHSDRLLELLLKAGRPEKYRERIDVTSQLGQVLIKPIYAEDLALMLPPDEADDLLNRRNP